eukprot:Amastigsp_a176548_16.p2 type:complete len:156 gc:universal Amastigsp_a176548_16:119-586(+)
MNTRGRTAKPTETQPRLQARASSPRGCNCALRLAPVADDPRTGLPGAAAAVALKLTAPPHTRAVRRRCQLAREAAEASRDGGASHAWFSFSFSRSASCCATTRASDSLSAAKRSSSRCFSATSASSSFFRRALDASSPCMRSRWPIACSFACSMA